MKIKIEKTQLLKALDKLKSVTDAKSTMPILSHVKIVADPDKLMGCIQLSATDLHISSYCEISCDVNEEGSICLPAKDFYDRLKLMPDGDVSIAVKDLKATIKAAKTQRKFVLQGLDASDFPTIRQVTDDLSSFNIKDKDLAERIDSTIYGVSLDETQPVINSLLLVENNGNTTFVGVDGHRMALLKSGDASGGSEYLIPLKAAKELLKLCRESASNKNEDHELVVRADNNILFVDVNQFTFSTLLSNGQYPPYKQIIPDTFEHEIKIEREKLINAVRAVSIATGHTGGVKLKFEKNKLTLNAENHWGTGDDEIDVEYDGPELVYGVNAHYLIQALIPVCSECAIFKASNALDPIMITQDTKGEEEYLAIVMPMRV